LDGDIVGELVGDPVELPGVAASPIFRVRT
jgi:hypothetical protein